MNQRLISTHVPYLPLTLTIQGRTETIEAFLDTGFDGDGVVPPDLVTASDTPDGYLQWTLADGSRVQAAAYLGTLQIGSFSSFPAVVTVLGDEPIVGRHVSDRFTIILDHGQQLIVEP
jgi:predicted aspartyl protease